MSWLYLQEQGADFSLQNYLAGIQSRQSKLGDTSSNASLPGSATASLSLSPSGTTSKPLTELPGGVLLTCFRGDSRAKTSVSQVRARDLSPELGQAFGLSTKELLTKFGLNLSLPKIHRCSAIADLTQSSKGLPAWGIMQDGVCLEVGTSVRPINATACGFWPTPNTFDGFGPRSREALIKQFTVSRPGRKSPANLREAVHPCCYPENLHDPEQYASDWARGELNPDWTEWLMGWPIGWTDLRPLGMDKYRLWLQQHSAYCPKVFYELGETEA